MSTEPPSRFQFSLRELLAIVGLACLSLLVVGPFVMRRLASPQYYWPPRVEYSDRAHLQAALLVTVVTCVGALVGLWLASLCRAGPWLRAASLLASALVGASGLFGVVGSWACPLPADSTSAAASCKAYQEAQQVYQQTDYNRDGALEYAQSLHELFETKPGAADVALVDGGFVRAEVVNGNAVPKYGYVYKVLKGQGPAAKGGARSYLARGADGKERMTEGFALAACPAVYNESGRDMFIISHDGTIYQTDFGPKTPLVLEQMTEFNPDPKAGWVSAK
ncbi:MAG: DUF2950 family protein [Planctomycetota bacterium]|nr:DUF2950 family protein [Planctomycetota bacterium]